MILAASDAAITYISSFFMVNGSNVFVFIFIPNDKRHENKTLELEETTQRINVYYSEAQSYKKGKGKVLIDKEKSSYYN